MTERFYSLGDYRPQAIDPELTITQGQHTPHVAASAGTHLPKTPTLGDLCTEQSQVFLFDGVEWVRVKPSPTGQMTFHSGLDGQGRMRLWPDSANKFVAEVDPPSQEEIAEAEESIMRTLRELAERDQ